MADVIIVSLAVLILMVVFDNTWNTIHSDSTGGNGPLNTMYWDNDSTQWYLQAVQQKDGYVLLYADLINPYSINTAVVFAKIVETPPKYSLQNCAIQGKLAIDFSRGNNAGMYSITIFLPGDANKNSANTFNQDGHGIFTEAQDNKWYLTVKNSQVMATTNVSEAKHFRFGGITNTKTTQLRNYCIPSSSAPNNT